MRVRVLRIVEIIGEYEDVEAQLARSMGSMRTTGAITKKPLFIRTATLGNIPELLDEAEAMRTDLALPEKENNG